MADESKTLLRFENVQHSSTGSGDLLAISPSGVLKLTDDAIVFTWKSGLVKKTEEEVVIPLSSILNYNNEVQIAVDRPWPPNNPWTVCISLEDSEETFTFLSGKKQEVQLFVETVNELITGEKKGFDAAVIDTTKIKDGFRKAVDNAKPIASSVADAAQPFAEAAVPIASAAAGVAAEAASVRHPYASAIATSVIDSLNTGGAQEAQPALQSEAEALASSGQEAASPNDQVEQMMAMKKLLDEGILTQEEFDAKKKEILGL